MRATHHHAITQEGLNDIQRAAKHLREVGELIEEGGWATGSIGMDNERVDDS